jgi:hypothetical protein
MSQSLRKVPGLYPLLHGTTAANSHLFDFDTLTTCVIVSQCLPLVDAHPSAFWITPEAGSC